jgi:hypothetical protein
MQQCNQAVTELDSNKIVDYRLLFESGVRHGEGWLIVRASELKFSDGLYAEVPFWCASGPTDRRGTVLRLESC